MNTQPSTLISELLESIDTERLTGVDEVMLVVDWESGGHIHNWKCHVPAYIEKQWDKMPIEAKLVVFIMASLQANDEEWD